MQTGDSHDTPATRVISAALTGPPAGGEGLLGAEAGSAMREHRSPLVGGLSISAFIGQAGTLGCFVVDFPRRFLLSTATVLAEPSDRRLGARIFQPARSDEGPQPARIVAHLETSARLNPGGESLADAALALISDDIATDPRILTDGNVLQRLKPPIAEPRVGMPVAKTGRTTGATTGVITATDVTTVMRFPFVSRNPFDSTTMRNAFAVAGDAGPFGAPGDSGALVWALDTCQPVGLFFAIDPDRQLGFAMPMHIVLDALSPSWVEIEY